MKLCINSLSTILISIPIGAFSSLIAWWILNYILKPHIKFSPDISKIKDQGHSIYRFKFENSGRRKIFEADLTAKLRIKGLKLKNNWEVIYLPFDCDKIPIIHSVRRLKNKLREVPRLELGLIDQKYLRFLSKELSEKIMGDTIELEELLKLKEDSEIILIVSGFDGLSGARKTFESKPYKLEDIKNGFFNNNGLNVK